MKLFNKLSHITIFLIAFALISISCLAQDGTTLMSAGVAGERDADGRNPELFVTKVKNGNTVSLLVDAHVPHTGYQQYPMQFDFYINRQFFTSQIRSKELPGPIGIDIGPDIATIPFNFAVIVKGLHPTRSLHAMVTGAVYDNELGGTFSCSASLKDESETKIFEAPNVIINQTANNQFTLVVKAFSSEGEELQYSGTLTIDGENITGVLKVGKDSVTLTNISGNASVSNGSLTSFDAKSSDETFSLACD
jgi:hypothetical protein